VWIHPDEGSAFACAMDRATGAFIDRQNSGKTVFEMEAEPEHLENSVTPTDGQR
jgi:hypothetical protein